MEPDSVLALAEDTPVSGLPRLIGTLAEAMAVANRRLLAPAPTPTPELPQLVDRQEAAHILGVSRYYLENKTLPCQQRAGRKVLYNKAKLLKYVEQGHVPYGDR